MLNAVTLSNTHSNKSIPFYSNWKVLSEGNILSYAFIVGGTVSPTPSRIVSVSKSHADRLKLIRDKVLSNKYNVL